MERNGFQENGQHSFFLSRFMQTFAKNQRRITEVGDEAK